MIGGGGVDGEVDRDLVQRQPGEQVGHVVGGVDGHADPADLGPGHLVAGVVAELGGQVERDRQRGLSLPEQETEPGVGLLRGAEPGELPHRPELAPVHRGIRPAGERRLAGKTEPFLQRLGPARHVGGGVDRRDRDAGVGRDGRLRPGRAAQSSRRLLARQPEHAAHRVGQGGAHGEDLRDAEPAQRLAVPGGIVPPTTSGALAPRPASRRAPAPRSAGVPRTARRCRRGRRPPPRRRRRSAPVSPEGPGRSLLPRHPGAPWRRP